MGARGAGPRHWDNANPFLLKPNATTPAVVSARQGSPLLALPLIFTCQVLFLSLAQAAPTTPSDTTYALAIVTNSIEALAGTTPDYAEEGPFLTPGNPAHQPVGSEELPGFSADRAKQSNRYYQGTPLNTNTTVDPIVLCRPGVIPAFLFSTHFSESMREHLRERAPPPAVASAKADPRPA